MREINIISLIDKKRVKEGDWWYRVNFNQLSPRSRGILDRIREKAKKDELIEEIAYDMFCKPRNAMLNKKHERTAASVFWHEIQNICEEFGIEIMNKNLIDN